MEIRIVAFHDGKGTSDAYRKFDTIEKAVDFYREQLEKGKTQRRMYLNQECRHMFKKVVG